MICPSSKRCAVGDVLYTVIVVVIPLLDALFVFQLLRVLPVLTGVLSRAILTVLRAILEANLLTLGLYSLFIDSK